MEGKNHKTFLQRYRTLEPNIIAYKTYKSKYVCGLSHITDPCVVYSLGSSGNMAFEKELLTKGADIMNQFLFTYLIKSHLSELLYSILSLL
jgi:hypothetical protein